MTRRWIALAFVVLGLLVCSPRVASAHALLAASEPAAGSVLEASPSTIVLTFTETPDPGLSTVHVTGRDGDNLERGKPTAVAGQKALSIAVPQLAKGSYSVSWRTTSTEDGHSSTGSFAFGVGVQPSAATATKTADPAPSGLSVAGRWLFYVGLALLLGGAVMVAIAPGPATRPGGQGLFGAWLVAALGGALLVADLVRATGVGLRDLLSTTTGSKLTVQLVALGVAGAAAEVVARRPSPRRVTALGVVTAAVMFTRVRAGHAAASSAPVIAIASQWVHLIAVGVWVGGLPWLVRALRRAEANERVVIARRFSSLATIALAAVLLTGTIRSIDEVESGSALFDTGYGRTLLVKLGLVVVVLGLAVLNRFRNVRRADRSLMRTGAVEAAVAAAVLVASAVLSGFTPAASIAASRRPPSVVTATGNDFGTTMRVRLAVTPGTVGLNHFDLRVADYDTDQPVAARTVSLRLTPAARPDAPATTVPLRKAGERWVGESPVLTIDGRWRAVVLVETSAGGTEVALSFRTREPPTSIRAQRTPGLPTIYTLTRGGRHVQAYVDPGRAGLNQVHFTYVDAGGAPVDSEAAEMTAERRGGDPAALTFRKLELGHYVADAELTAGRWTFTARAADGFTVSFQETIQS